MRRAMICRSMLLLVAVASACGPRPGGAPEPVQRTIRFENSSDAAVRVYLVGAGQDWLLGRVGSASNMMLRVPAGFPSATASTVSLVAVPLGALDLLGAGASQVPDAIHSGPYRLDDLLGMRWALRGERLFAHPLGPKER